MSRKHLYFIGLSCAVIIILASILHTLNPESVEFRPWYGESIKTSVANLMLGYFLLGCFLVGGIAVVLELQRIIQIKWIKLKDKRREQFYSKLIKLREELSLKNYKESAILSREIIATDSVNVLAHISLISALRDGGQLEEALRASDKARSLCETNVELLLLSAEISILAKNYTSALDNLNLALLQAPKNSFVLRRAVEVSVLLGRLSDAISYQERLIKLMSGGVNYDLEQNRLAELGLAEILNKNLPADELQISIKELLKKHRNFAPALRLLAECYKNDTIATLTAKQVRTSLISESSDKGTLIVLEEGLKLLSQAFKVDPKIGYLRDGIIWALALDRPSRSLSFVRSVLDETKKNGLDVAPVELLYIQLLVHLENNTEAANLLNDLDSRKEIQRYRIDYEILKAVLMRHRGEQKAALSKFLSLLLDYVLVLDRGLLKFEVDGTGSYAVSKD